MDYFDIRAHAQTGASAEENHAVTRGPHCDEMGTPLHL